ncbi:TPA: DUF1983 domain-containing protein [Escherichia coli]
MDQIANLVIDLGIDAAEFKNEIPRIKNLLNGAASDAERSSARMQRLMERQTQAARQTMQAASSAATAASVHAQTVEKSAQAHERMACEVEQTRQRMEALSQKMREEQAQAMALAEAQDKAAAAFYRQIDSVKQASAGLQELQRIQQQIRQARNSGGIGQQDYLALISEVTAKTRVLTQAEAEATRQKVAFIRQLKEQATRQNLSSSELLRAVDGSGNPVSVEVQSVTDGVKVKVSRVPDGVAGYSVWGLKLPTLRQRLFRCVSIRENDDGTYAITAVQHVPEKEAIVDNGAHFDGDQSGTVNGVTPPAVQHLTAEVTADSEEYQVLARWDTPKVVKGVSFMLRLTVAADDGSERLVSTARTTETTYRFRQLALGRYTLTVRAVNARGQQGDPASVSFRIAAPAAPSRIELTPGYFQITATPHLAVYDPTVQFEFWFSETRITDIRQVETTARYLGTGLYWIAASINIKPGHDYYFYIRSVNTVGKSAFVEAVGRASDDAEGYLDFFKGKITESHLGQELLEKVDLTEDNASRLEEFSKEWKDASDKWNAMWGVKIEQTKDGKHYVAGIGLSMEDTEEGKLSQFLVAANRIAFIDPANGNETPMFVAQGNQIFMNDVFLKRLTAPTITSGGSPPVFSLTSDGKLTAKNADISGSVNANSGTLNNVTINQNCTIKGMLEATQVRGDFVKAVSKAFPKKVGTWGNTETPNGTVTVTISDDHNFDRQIIIPPIIFNGIAYDDPGSGNNPGGTRYTGYGFEVRKNGVLIASRETKGAIPGSYSAVIDMPSGGGSVTLEFKIFQKGNQGAGNITDCTVIVTKKAASGISIR